MEYEDSLNDIIIDAVEYRTEDEQNVALEQRWSSQKFVARILGLEWHRLHLWLYGGPSIHSIVNPHSDNHVCP